MRVDLGGRYDSSQFLTDHERISPHLDQCLAAYLSCEKEIVCPGDLKMETETGLGDL